MSYYYSNPGGFSISKTVLPSITSSICQSAGLNSGGVVRENAVVSTSSTAVLPFMQETKTTTITTTQTIQKTFSTISELSFNRGTILFQNYIFGPTYHSTTHSHGANLANYLVGWNIEPDIGLNSSNVLLTVNKTETVGQSEEFIITFTVKQDQVNPPIFTNPLPTIYFIYSEIHNPIRSSEILVPTLKSQTITQDLPTTSTSTIPLHTSSFQQEVDNNPKLILLK
jgi:hypothetical protein